jgi:N-acetylmuramoyl-L-alanine amidase
MSLILKRASVASIAATFLMMITSAMGSGAAAQETVLTQAEANKIPYSYVDSAISVATPSVNAGEAVMMATNTNLADIVAAQPQDQDISKELECLAGAIYFEARNESLAGQLAVGRVIVARTKSGRFPTSYCGVVYQPSQFSFVRSQKMPVVAAESPTWRKAVAMARIAHAGQIKSAAEGALYFHAKRVRPNWANHTKLAQIENHIFYR